MTQRVGATLKGLTATTEHLHEVRKEILQPGDWLLVKTVESVYNIRVLGRKQYEVSGGWFDKRGLSPAVVSIAGCTWGGSAIKVNIVAACGLRIEFGNRVITSPIQRIIVLPRNLNN